MTEQVLPELPPGSPAGLSSVIHSFTLPAPLHLSTCPRSAHIRSTCRRQGLSGTGAAPSQPGLHPGASAALRVAQGVQMRKLGGVVRAVEGRFLRADAALLLGSTGEETGPGEERSGPRRGVAWPG